MEDGSWVDETAGWDGILGPELQTLRLFSFT